MESCGPFTQYRIRLIMACFLYFRYIFLQFPQVFTSLFFDKFYMQVCICPVCIHLISLFDPCCLYLHVWVAYTSAAMTVCKNKEINRIYIPIWVASAEATRQLCRKLFVFHPILFLGPTEIFLDSGLDYSLFCVLLIGRNGMFEVLKAEINSQISKIQML